MAERNHRPNLLREILVELFVGLLIISAWGVALTLSVQYLWRHLRQALNEHSESVAVYWREWCSERLLRQAQQRLYDLTPATDRIETYDEPRTSIARFMAVTPCPTCGFPDIHGFVAVKDDNSVQRQCDNCGKKWWQS